MDLKLNVQKRGLSTTAATINEEFTLHYGHIFKGEKGEKGDKGEKGASIVVDTELSETSNNAIANSVVTKGLNGKQETLTLETKSNGNIVVGNLAGQTKEFMPATPSGDPMHYAYETIGAVWNASTGYWEFLGVKNMTNEDMLEEILLGNSRIYPSANLMNLSTTERVIFGRKNLLLDSGWSAVKADNLASFNERLEVVQFSTHESLPVILLSFDWACYECRRLRTFLNILDVSIGGINSTFGGCVSLETIMLRGLNKDASFADSPLLSKESLLYMINNCASGASFTITLHHNVDDKCQNEWLEEIDSALGRAETEKQTNITLARA